jgi:putative endonuclease
MVKGGSVYILTNKNQTTLYTGVTSDLSARIQQHRTCYYPNSFSARYRIFKLIYYENFGRIEEAISREKYIKGKKRSWKNALVSNFNPGWKDLTSDVLKW